MEKKRPRPGAKLTQEEARPFAHECGALALAIVQHGESLGRVGREADGQGQA